MDVLLFSAGIDSLLADWTLKKQGNTCLLVYYATRSRCCKAEIENISNRKIPTLLDVSLTLDALEAKDAYVPNRNLLMALHASGAYKPDAIYIGGTKSDRVSDNNEEIMVVLSGLIEMSLGKPMKVTSPFWNKYKIEVAKEFVQDDDGNAELLKQTFSCYDPVEGDDQTWSECLRCAACFRKNVILHGVGVESREFRTPHLVKKYEKEFDGLTNNQHTPRSIATLEYIKWLRNR